jgi:hypothetical protein
VERISWRNIAELVGIAAIVASLIFVGLELRQSQQIARIDAANIRAGWVLENRTEVNDHAEIWAKGNAGSDLTDTESVIYSNLIRSMHTNNRFTWAREQRIGITGANYAAHELAWFLHKNPAALREWNAQVSDRNEMTKALMPDVFIRSFSDIVRADLDKLEQ